MKFIQELNESRLYRRLGDVKGMPVSEIAERLFEHLLALELLTHEDPSAARAMANDVMSQQHFTGFRVTQPDLYNLITLMLNQNQFNDQPDSTMTVPEMRLKRVLRGISTGTVDYNDFDELMFMLQRRFSSIPGQLIQLRRQMSDYRSLTNSERRNVLRRLMQHMRERGTQSDMYQRLSRLESQHSDRG